MSDDDMVHALYHPIREFIDVGKWALTMVIGPGTDGTLVEIGIAETQATIVVVHAMRARTKYR